ncbi:MULTISPECIES: GAF and ANTAR domain-containing protein [unclassified Curtobacterium]|uniref:GAF and ANTAR domain-containing protein n=1 Tax=unclassified Curtobacterium TaxID=257496 RepID=UPI00226B39A1|nr:MULTISPECIES: GAF and ANTAR domain-containing protein [unclassified Curtobacterium]
MDDAVKRAFRAIRSFDVPDDELGESFRQAMPLGSVSVSSFGVLGTNETISASDDTALRVDEIQLDLTEGPCWAALSRRNPVLEGDIVQHPNSAWPAFNEAVLEVPVRAVFAFPIVFGPFPLGAVDLYAPEPTDLEHDRVEIASALATAMGRRVLRRAVQAVEDEDALVDRNPFSRRVVHQATGVVLAQLDITPDDATLLIQGHAFARKTSMRQVAEEIISGAVRFEKHGGLIEDVR